MLKFDHNWRDGFGDISAVGLSTVLTAAMVAGPLPFFALAVLAPVLRNDLNLSPSRLGLLTLIYYLVAAACSPAAGLVSDRFHSSGLLQLLFLCSGLTVAAMALAPNVWVLALALAVAGIPQALSNPVTNRAMLTYSDPQHRSNLIGIKQSGGQLAAFIAGATLPSVASVTGDWRLAFLVCAIPAGLGLVLTRLIIPARRPVSVTEYSEHNHEAASWRHVEFSLTIYGLFMGGGISAVTTFVPSYGHDVIGMTPEHGGALVAIMGIIAFAARITWSRIIPRLHSQWLLLPIQATCAVIASIMIAAGSVLGRNALWAAAILLGATAMAWTISVTIMIVNQFEWRAGIASGRIMMATLSGYTIAPFLFGLLVEAVGYFVGWIMVSAWFAGALLVSLSQRRLSLTSG